MGFPSFDRQTTRGRAAYIFNDGGENEITQVFKRFGAKEGEDILIHCGGVPVDPSAWLLGLIKAHDLKFVVIDTLQRFFRFKNLNDYSEVTNVMEPLLNSVGKLSCHIMFIHHAKKDSQDALDGAVGSTALRGLCYSFLHYRRLIGSDQRILMTDQRAGLNLAECAVDFDPRSGWLKITGTMEDAEMVDMKHRIKELLSVAEGPTTRQQIQNQLWPCRDYIMISRAVKELYESGQISRRGSGLRGSPFKYTLD